MSNDDENVVIEIVEKDDNIVKSKENNDKISNMDNLNKRHCEACRVGSLPVTDSELKIFSENFKEWELLNENGIRKIKKQFKFPNFQEALSFTIKMGKLSEEQGHHPLLTLEWGKVSVIWWTHKIKDLHMNDFIMASKTDELFMKYY